MTVDKGSELLKLSSLYHDPAWIQSMSSRCGPRRVALSTNKHQNIASFFFNDEPWWYGPFNLPLLLFANPPIFPESCLPPSSNDTLHQAQAELLPSAYFATPGYGDPFILDQAFDVPKRLHRAQELLNLLEARAHSLGAATAAILYVPVSDAVNEALIERGYKSYPATSRCTIPVPGGGLERYVDSLQPGQRRKKVAKELRLLKGSQVRSYISNEDSDWDCVLPIRAAHLRWLGETYDDIAEHTRLNNLRTSVIDLKLLITAWEGSVVAVTLFVERGDCMFALMMSIDHDKSPEYATFQANFYGLVDVASESVRNLDVGIGHVEAKSRRGANTTALEIHIKPLTRAAELLLTSFDDRIRQTATVTSTAGDA